MTDVTPWVTQAREHLRKALDEQDSLDKNFHIRAALQELSADDPEPR